jgi:serine O-acetyltransferase
VIFGRIREDIRNVFTKDPAARGVVEVLLCYPGLHAVWIQRVAHVFWGWKFYLLARLLSHLARHFTGIEIHPGAAIGRRFFIDHGMGVVIGETSEIGDDVLMYQGVVLGGTTLEKVKRHPTIRDGAVIGAGAIVLGAITVGEGARVGAGSVVIKDVEPHTVVVGIPARVTGAGKGAEPGVLEHGKLSDPVANAIQAALDETDRRLKALKEEMEKRTG